MDCATVRGKLEEYLDGQLPASSRQAVETHLADCAECRAGLALLCEVDEAMASWPIVAEPEGLTARVMERIRSAEATAVERPSRLHVRVQARLRARWQDAVLGLALGLTVVVLLVSARYVRTVDIVEWTALDLQVQRSLSTIEGAWYAARTGMRHVRADIVRIFGWMASGIAIAAAAVTAIVLAVQWPKVPLIPFWHGHR